MPRLSRRYLLIGPTLHRRVLRVRLLLSFLGRDFLMRSPEQPARPVWAPASPGRQWPRNPAPRSRFHPTTSAAGQNAGLSRAVCHGNRVPLP
jgi:hypothetical protein